MFNLFKKGQSPTLDAIDAQSKKTAKTIEQIHNEFATAGGILLENAKKIIANSIVKDESKVVYLQKFGFNSAAQVREASNIQRIKQQNQYISEAISDFHAEYPLYKFITDEIAETICKKYNLVLGDVSQYKGFVPMKNVEEIAKFFELYPNDEFNYYRHSNNIAINPVKVSKSEYDKNKHLDGSGLRIFHPLNLGYGESCDTEFYYKAQPIPLKICAPLKDMDMKGQMLMGVKIVPDPVVLLPKEHKNKTKGYLVITAWGDEASDELVVNQNMN